jgi:Tfp pilus assembly protein PilF
VIELEDLDGAATDLEAVADRVPDLDQYHLVRCKLYAKQGDTAKAQAEFEEAQKINPQVEQPAGLN